jgi:hypothetical protein
MSNVLVNLECEDIFNAFLQCLKPKYKLYKALISQTNEDNPTVIVLQNTLGVDIEWSRLSEGYYRGTPSLPVFNQEKTFHFVNSNNQGYQFEVTSHLNGEDDWRISVIDGSNPSDNSLELLPIEIQVYN